MRDLVRDPIGTLRRVYAAFGEELDGAALAAMTQHVESHPKGRFGQHSYNLAEFGLDGGAIAERFRGIRAALRDSAGVGQDRVPCLRPAAII